MREIDVALTDFALGLEALACAGLLVRLPCSRGLKSALVTLFVGFAFAAVTGGIFHGFFSGVSAAGAHFTWWLTLAFTGVAAYGFASAATWLTLDPRQARLADRWWLAGLCAILIVTLFEQDFRVAIATYVPAVLLMLAALARQWALTRSGRILTGIAGLVLSLIAPALQQMRVAVESLGLTHNAVYHIVLMVAVWLFFIGVRAAVSATDRGEHAQMAS